MSSISLFQVFLLFTPPSFISPATAIAPKPYLRPINSINSKQQTALAPALSNTQAVSSADAEAGVATRGGSAASGLSVAPLAILGGFLTHLTLGTLYCWGNFQSYLPPSMKYFAGLSGSGTPDSLYVIPLGMVFMCIGMPMSSFFQARLGLPLSMLFGSLLMAGGVYLSSFATTLASFMVTYAVMFGFGVGLAYTAPIVAGWKHFPARRGLVSGCILGGFGSGGFLFNMVGSALANPDKLALDPETKLFPSAVYDNFPGMLRRLALIYASMQVVGALLLKTAGLPAVQASSGKAAGASKYSSLKEAVFSKQFVLLWSCIMLSATAGLNTVSVYKMFGNQFPALKSDAYLAMVGGLGSVANGVGRTGWGILQDKLGFRTLFTFLTAMQAVAMMLYKYTVGNRTLFTGTTMVLFLCLGGNFAMAPGACGKLFGADMGPKVFAVLFSAFATAAIGGSAINKQLMGSLGFDAIFKVLAALSVLAGVTV
eukprot:CAMPEP_0182519836 /NCGR_PEP_ID=MMETSP1321-20130603/45304_1 /TAXON_ID=91990 /ORGANISM="Bolidomonas sp., Strain RCC1657" /LENGTH=483 /DNA_ID=CAMNT_0024727827 /DNA_START=1051 /DNA_END=2498 /DNA_ORIENTATION=+